MIITFKKPCNTFSSFMAYRNMKYYSSKTENKNYSFFHYEYNFTVLDVLIFQITLM